MIEFTDKEPRPGTLKMFSITIAPDNMEKIIGIRILESGMNELRIAWRTVACICDRPFILANSI
ncbi:ATPase with chaperone activity, ATP-binding subunit [Paenibacillus sp. NAIST15-1]|nr:ATPase with chaperone activity, ATP-binding subunit [Paenibacillus sp. NAIST15-1]